MKKIRKNAVNQIKEIISNMKDCTVYTHKNNYKGEPYEPDETTVKAVIDDVKEGYAILYATESKNEEAYMLQYAGRCRWFFDKK
ncbi:hypothetical protein AB3N02_22155 [Priestia aryabhattai]|uniref:hypothetical protein n=1 Tax=Priestia aryabhattai TaxID=412384 RepID=UPI0039A24C8B